VKRAEPAVAVVFLLLGLYLLFSARQFPPGVGGIPGPGFFPAVIGAAMLVLALPLLLTRGAGPRPTAASQPALITVSLLAAYLLLWNHVPFSVRTALFLAIYLRCLGQPWRASLKVAAVLTLGVVAAFQYGLRVNLP
jgi:hypothetical protein